MNRPFRPTFDRRRMIAWMAQAGLAAGGLPLAGIADAAQAWPRNVDANPKLPDYPFTLGVASGDPAVDGFVIWTRIAPRPDEPHGGMGTAPVLVQWEVSETDSFATLTAQGTALASPELAHSVHVEVEGLLPDRPYFYRFRIAGHVSAVGRSRSLPLPHARLDRLRFAVAGCQHYEHGFYTAWRHIAAEPVDFIFHYGDYIYEINEKGADQITIQGNSYPRARRHTGPEPISLDDYRRRYAQGKQDADLQAAHAAAPFWVSFDDHEVDNDWADAMDQEGTPPEVFLYRRAAAFQAYYEHMPLRRRAMPDGPRMAMHRAMRYGDLMNGFVLDTRQHRSDQVPGPYYAPITDAVADPRRTMMGAAQEAWLFNGLSRSDTRWNLIAQQVMLMHLSLADKASGTEGYNLDRWSGYLHSRRRLLAHIERACPGNVVTVCGDAHLHYAGNVAQDQNPEKTIASEFLATSISSGADGQGDDTFHSRHALAHNPGLKAVCDRRGYVLCDVGRDVWHADLKTVDRVTTPGGRLDTYRRFAVERGKPGVVSA